VCLCVQLLIGFESGCIVLWDLKNKNAEFRYTCVEVRARVCSCQYPHIFLPVYLCLSVYVFLSLIPLSYNDKVDAVRASTAATPLYDVPHRTTTTMTEWRDVTSDEVGKLINAAPNKTCQLDPAPTWLVKDMRGLLAPFLSMLFNKSLTTGCFPSQFNEVVVRPRLK